MLLLNGFQHSKWLNSSIWFIDGISAGITTLYQSGTGSNGSKGILHIPQRSRAWDSPSHVLVSYPDHSFFRVSYSSAEMQSVDSTALEVKEKKCNFKSVSLQLHVLLFLIVGYFFQILNFYTHIFFCFTFLLEGIRLWTRNLNYLKLIITFPEIRRINISYQNYCNYHHY